MLNSWKSLLVLTQTPNQVHPVWKKISMLVVHLSGSLQKGNYCQKMLLKSYQVRGAGTGKMYNSHSEKFFKFCRERYLVIPFKQPLSHRLEIAILSCLTTGQRDQTIKCLYLNYIKIFSDKVVLFVPQTLKTNQPGHHLPPIEI